jgi:small subunit ribosomal protein S2
MVDVKLEELLEAGVHLGHQKARWNPKMKPYIYGSKNGIHIINLAKTVDLLNQAITFVTNCTSQGGKVLFVGTKKQAQDIIVEEANKCAMHYVTFRWLGGTLTNFVTIRASVERLKNLEKMVTEDKSKLIKKEILTISREIEKLTKNLIGIKEMKRLPDCLFVIDPNTENIAVREALKLNIPIIGLVDTNCNPDSITHLIPGNDDAIKSIKLITSKIGAACVEGWGIYTKKVESQNKKIEKESE